MPKQKTQRVKIKANIKRNTQIHFNKTNTEKFDKAVNEIVESMKNFRSKFNTLLEEFTKNLSIKLLNDISNTMNPDFEKHKTLLKIHKPFIKKICNDILQDDSISMDDKTSIVKSLDLLKTPKCFKDV